MVSKVARSNIQEHWLFRELLTEKTALTKCFFLNFIIYSFQIVTSLFVMVVYNKVLPNDALKSLISLVIGIAVVLVFDLLFKLLKSRIMNNSNDSIDAKLQQALFKKILSWDLQNRPKLSGASSTLIRDLESVIELFTNSSITTLIGLPFVLINCFVIYLIAGPLVIVTIIIVFLALSTSLIFYALASNMSEQSKQASIDKNSVYLEALNNLETLKSVADYKFFISRFKKADDENRLIGSKLKNILGDANSLNTLLSSLSQICLVAIGATLVINGVIDAGALIGSMILNGKTIQPVMQIANLLQKYSVAKISYKKLNQTFNFQSEEEKRAQNISLTSLEGPLRIENLTFQPDGLQSPVLTAKRIIINKGERIGIVGSVGSGKSTLLKLVSGVLTPTTGTICFGPFDNTAINQTDLRKHLSYLGQSPGVFSGSIRENLTFGDENYSDQDIVLAMKVTGFDIILKKFPNGLSYTLSENGSELSGGQKQILALTRAILSQPEYIILDEPTSAMDPKHEKLFINQMSKFLAEKTLLVVTHRKPILALTDRIIVVENGNIILDGKRDEILNKFS